jgi:ABC-2 type transport system ATP-binding protein
MTAGPTQGDPRASTTAAVGPPPDAGPPPAAAEPRPDEPVTAEPVPTASREPVATPTDAPADDLVVMHDVSRSFEGRAVVRGIDLHVPRGTILGVIGPSGAGKTTTIRMLTGAIAPTSGEVRVLGREPKRFRRSDRERIGYMPQLFNLYDDLTAGENVDFVASLFGMLFRRRRRRVREVLQVVELWDVRGRQAGRLSGGMRRRLELACALVHEPELIILDEPTAGLDPLLRGTIWEELHRLRDAGRTLLVTTQHVSEAEECDAVALIDGGRIVALASPDALRRSATNGDLLDVETASPFEGTDLLGTEGVSEVSQDGPRHLRVVVEDAGTALPAVVERIRSSGIEVEAAREHRLSFDEIFAVLVARGRGEGDPGSGVAAASEAPSSGDGRGGGADEAGNHRPEAAA